MKVLFSFVLAFYLSFVCAFTHAQPPQVLHLAANEWEPYTGDKILNKGLSTDMVRTALERAGYEVDVHIVPWTRALKGLEAGQYDGIIAIWHTNERTKTMAYSDPYMTNDVVLFKRTGYKISYKNLKDLNGLVVGTQRDYAYDEAFDQATNFTKKPAIELRTNIVRLSKGIIDLFPEDKFVVKHLLNTKYPEYFGKINFLDNPLSQRTLHMTISKGMVGYEKVIADFNRELAAMREEGLWDQLIEKHNLNF